MIRAAICTLLCIAVPAATAEAADTQIRALFGQTGEVSDNRNLSPNPKGESYTSTSTLVVDAIARTPTTTMQLTGDLAYRMYGGPGDRETPDAFDKGVVGNISHQEQTTRYFFGGLWRQADASSVQLLENGFSTLSGFVTTTAINGGFDRAVSTVDSISFFASGTSTEFSTTGGTPFVDLFTRGTWNHKVNRTLDVLTSIEYQRLVYDNTSNTETQFLRALVGLQSRVVPRLVFIGNVGVGWVRTDNDMVALTPSASGSTVGFLGDLLLTYELLRTTTVSFMASQTIGPTSLGELFKRSTVGASLSHAINHSSYLLFATQFTRSTQAAGDPMDFIFASATYGVRLTQEWRTELSYIFRHREPSTASSNTVTIRVLRDLVVLP